MTDYVYTKSVSQLFLYKRRMHTIIINYWHLLAELMNIAVSLW